MAPLKTTLARRGLSTMNRLRKTRAPTNPIRPDLSWVWWRRSASDFRPARSQSKLWWSTTLSYHLRT